MKSYAGEQQEAPENDELSVCLEGPVGSEDSRLAALGAAYGEKVVAGMS